MVEYNPVRVTEPSKRRILYPKNLTTKILRNAEYRSQSKTLSLTISFGYDYLEPNLNNVNSPRSNKRIKKNQQQIDSLFQSNYNDEVQGKSKKMSRFRRRQSIKVSLDKKNSNFKDRMAELQRKNQMIDSNEELKKQKQSQDIRDMLNIGTNRHEYIGRNEILKSPMLRSTKSKMISSKESTSKANSSISKYSGGVFFNGFQQTEKKQRKKNKPISDISEITILDDSSSNDKISIDLSNRSGIQLKNSKTKSRQSDQSPNFSQKEANKKSETPDMKYDRQGKAKKKKFSKLKLANGNLAQITERSHVEESSPMEGSKQFIFNKNEASKIASNNRSPSSTKKPNLAIVRKTPLERKRKRPSKLRINGYSSTNTPKNIISSEYERSFQDSLDVNTSNHNIHKIKGYTLQNPGNQPSELMLDSSMNEISLNSSEEEPHMREEDISLGYSDEEEKAPEDKIEEEIGRQGKVTQHFLYIDHHQMTCFQYQKIKLSILKESLFKQGLHCVQYLALERESVPMEMIGLQKIKKEDESYQQSKSNIQHEMQDKNIQNSKKKMQKLQERILVMKFSPDNSYLALASTSGNLSILKILDDSKDRTNLLFESEYSSFQRVSTLNSIVDFSWTNNSSGIMVLTLDKKLNLWSVSEKKLVLVLEYSEIPSCISFHPEEMRIFVTGSLDKILRATDIVESNRVTDWIQGHDHITSLAFSRGESQYLVIGFNKGLCRVYDYTNKFEYSTEFVCRNSNIRHSQGKKVVNIEFVGDNEFYVCTNDSRIRRFSYETKFDKPPKLELKYKGHLNEKYPLRISVNK